MIKSSGRKSVAGILPPICDAKIHNVTRKVTPLSETAAVHAMQTNSFGNKGLPPRNLFLQFPPLFSFGTK